MSPSLLVYGDRAVARSLDAALDRVARLCEMRVHAPAQGELRSDLMLEAGALCQAVQDEELARLGEDELTPLSLLVLRLAAQVASLEASPSPAQREALFALTWALRGRTEVGALRIKVPEGFAFYAVYPELYASAAWALCDERERVQVIGIRSIGATLGPVVAAAIGTKRLPLTVRPVGHPFARELRIGPALERALCEDARHTRYAVVDEGPGLSGSSFGAVLDWLGQRGVAQHQVVLFPSHRGLPGAAASPAQRERYERCAKQCVTFDEHFLAGTRPIVARWFEHATGRRARRVIDVSAGAWRAFACPQGAPVPAANVQQERRKLLVDDGERCWLMRYLGLGPSAEGLQKRAEALSSAGLVPELVALAHGFTIGPWLHDARPAAFERIVRADLVDQVTRHVTFIACSFPASHDAGARPHALLDAAKHNVTQLLSADAADALRNFDALVPTLEDELAPVMVDAKLEAHEWLVTPTGRIFKADALDHHAGHDFVGCQPAAWDVAGAQVELELSAAELDGLLRALHDGAGVRLTSAQRAFYELMYLSFRAAQATLAADTLAAAAPDDAARLHARADGYTRTLAARLREA